MNLAHWVAKHRRSVLFLVSILAIGGFSTAFKLPVSLFPHVNFPRIVVSIDSGDRPADQMSIAVTRPLEEVVRSVPGVKSLRSTTSRGGAEISVNFNWGHDMVAALLQIDAAINQTLPSLPQGTGFNVRRMDPTVFPIAAYSLTSSKLSLVELRDIGEFELAPYLTSVDGVAKVAVTGGDESELRVEIDPEKLDAYGLAFDDIVNAVSASNTLQAVGRIEDHYKLYLLLSDTRIQSINDIKNSIVASGNEGLVRLEDIANIYSSTKPQWIKVNADGQDAVLIQVYQQPTGNSVQISRDIKKRLAEFSTTTPGSLQIANWYDQSVLVVASATSVRDAIIIGVLLAALVLFLFLRSLKIALVALLIVPSVLAATALLLWVMNMSFNIMTLGGMAAAVGLIVDDAIVMIEHIVRRVRETNNHVKTNYSIQKAAIEFTRPLAGSSAATIIIFLPLAFLSGVTGAFFKALSITMASSLVVSFFIAWLAVPLLAEYLISEKDAEKDHDTALFSKILSLYSSLVYHLLKYPIKVFLGVIPIMALGCYAYLHVGSGFIPAIDEGGFVLDYTTDPGTSLTETDRLLKQIEQILTNHEAVDTYSRRTGLQLGAGLTEANEGDFFIRLKPLPHRPPIDKVMDDIRNEIETKIPGIEIELVLLMEDVIGDLTAVPQPIEIKLYSDNELGLRKLAPQVAKKIAEIPGVVDVKDGIVLAGNAISVTVNPDKAGIEGITPDAVTHQLEAWFNGVIGTEIQDGVKLIGVRLWVPLEQRDMSTSLKHMWLRSKDGRRVPLNRVATINFETGQPQIVRDNLKNMVAVTARITGRDMGSTIKDINRTLAQKDLLPSDIYFELGGLFKEQQSAFKGLVVVFIAAITLVFLLLVFLYEEFTAAIAIIISPILSLAAVFIGLWITNSELNITAMMGMTMIVGIVTEVSIFYFSEYHDLLSQKYSSKEALVLAGSNRLRPITMTTLAAILALLPLGLAFGQGAAMQQPLAIAIISGLIIQIPLVTILTPIVYNNLQKLAVKISTRDTSA